MHSAVTPDRLNEIGVLKRREIEARIVGPLIEALGHEFGRERVVEIVRAVVVRIAHEQGAQLAEVVQGKTLAHFAQGLQFWTQEAALQLEVVEQNDEKLSFNVTRCRYAELYQALGLAELGATLSCNRDFALIEGFNPEIALTRTQTIMEGAAYCNFRYQVRPVSEPETVASHDASHP